ncbi:MAG: MFS transporter, partial [Glaciihabitans sp.]
QQVAGYPATAAAAALLPMTVLNILLSSYFGNLSGRFGPRLFMTIGPIVGGAGDLLLLRGEGSVHYWFDVFPGIVVFGLGLSMTVAPLTAAILGSISAAQSGIGSAVNNAVSRVAGLVAIALAGVIVGDTLDTDGFHRGLIATAVLLVAGGLVSAAGIRNPTRTAAAAPTR